MNDKLQIIMVLISLVTAAIIIHSVYNSKMEIKYSIIWIVGALGVILLSLFPNVLNMISSMLGIATPTNALFMISIFLVYIMIFYLFKKISSHHEEIKNMSYEIAKLKKEIREITKQKDNNDE